MFLHLLIIANWEEGTYLGQKLKPGDCVIGRKRLAQELGLSEQQVRTALKKLESTGEISLFSTNRYTIATVENWGMYQGDSENANQQATNKQPTDNQQATNKQPHLKKEKNNKNKKKGKNPPLNPPTGGRRGRRPRNEVLEMLKEELANDQN